jgi:type II restriction/modification system DNA methylase subunit YeeA
VYGLVGAGAGGFKRDLAMLFLARCFDLYLKPGGRHGFLMPFTVFKTQAGAGFRMFLATKSRIIKIHDMVTLYPFEGAVNRTSAIVIEKICELGDIGSGRCQEANKITADNKRIKHVIWINRSGKAIPTDASLEEVLKITDRFETIMTPIMGSDLSSPWMQATPRAVDAVRKLLPGKQYYKAHAGVYVALNQVYYIQVRGKTPDGKLVITNPPEPGAKKKVKQVDATVEPDLVYPLLRGKDVKKWYIDFKERYIVLPHYEDGKPIPHSTMKIKYPLTWQYLYQFFNDLINRSGGFLKQKLAPYKKYPIEQAEKLTVPFYYVMNNVKASLAPYKVVWKEVSARMGAGGFHVAVLEHVSDTYLGNKTVVPDHTVVLIPLASREEAYYLAGVLNSILVALVLQYAVVSSVENLSIPVFDPNKVLHRKIAELSVRAHELARCLYAKAKPSYCSSVNAEEDLRRVERELDLVVAQLFGLSEEDLREFEKLMAILSGEELPAEEEVEVPEEPKVSVLNTLLPPDTRSYIEVDVVNPSSEEVEFYYEFPWGRGSFKVVEGRYRVETPPLKPGKYSGVLRYRWRGVERVIEVVVEVSEPPGPRRRRGLLPGSG